MPHPPSPSVGPPAPAEGSATGTLRVPRPSRASWRERVSALGLSVVVRYTLKGGTFYTEDVPTPDSSADLVKAINQALTSGTTSQAIVFDVAFATPPRALSLNLSAPDSGATFGFQVRESTRTAAGFTVDFDATVPASGYKLTGIALL